MPIDLDKLERLEREATPGPWNLKGRAFGYDIFAGRIIDFSGGLEAVHGLHLCRISELDRDGESNLDLLIALRNAAPALFARLRAYRERIAELERDARLGAAVRAAAALEEDDHIAGRTVLHAIYSVLREEEGEEAGDAV